MRTIIGIALLVLGLATLGFCAFFELATSGQPTSSDLWTASQPVVSAELAGLEQSSMRLEGHIPSSKAWSVVVQRLGTPKFWVGAVTPYRAVSPRTFSDSEVPLAIAVSVAGRSVGLLPSTMVPYGYSSFGSGGRLFEAAAGQAVVVEASTRHASLPAGRLVVLPVWGGWKMLDYLNGANVVDEFGPLIPRYTAAGALATAIGMALLSAAIRRRRRTTG